MGSIIINKPVNRLSSWNGMMKKWTKEDRRQSTGEPVNRGLKLPFNLLVIYLSLICHVDGLECKYVICKYDSSNENACFLSAFVNGVK